MMNGYERAENRRTERMRAERERAFDELLWRRLKTSTHAESVQELYRSLTFLVGEANLLTETREKTPV